MLTPFGLSYTPTRWDFRDRFDTNGSAPLTSPRTCEPGPGTATINDVENIISIASKRLIGFGQSTPVWGEARYVLPAVTRSTGKAFMALLTLQDLAGLAMGFATANNIGDPHTDGVGFISENGANKGRFTVITPGTEITVSTGAGCLKPIQYLVVVALRDTGAYVLISSIAADAGVIANMTDIIGVPQFPMMRLLWATKNGSTATLYPYISGYDNPNSYLGGHKIEDIRVRSLKGSWNVDDGIADFADRTIRADSNTAIGNSWTTQSNVFGISGNKIYHVSGSTITVAWVPTNIYDGMFQADITVPADWPTNSPAFGIIVRRQDNNNYIRWWSNGGNTSFLQVWKNGVFNSTIHSTAFTFNAGQTYRWTLLTKGNQYKMLIDDVAIGGDVWRTDAGNNFLTSTGFGIISNTNAGKTTRWTNLEVYAHNILAPIEVYGGACPLIITDGATIASDTFTGTDATLLPAHTPTLGNAWTSALGTWEILGNAAHLQANGADGNQANVAVQDVAVNDVSLTISIITQATLSTSQGLISLGLVLRYTDNNNYLYVRITKNASAGHDTVELYQVVAGTHTKLRSCDVGTMWLASTTYVLSVKCLGDTIQAFVDGNPRIVHQLAATFAGTKFGLYENNTEKASNTDSSRPTMDNYVVKAVN
jgi:hypothetical protein